MSDLNFQNISSVANNLQPLPPTIASAATIAPTTFLSFISGTVALATITPPVTGAHMLCFIFTNGSPAALATTGNIKTAAQPIQNLPTFLIYDPVTALYWPAITVAS